MFATKYDDDLGVTGNNELKQISYGFPYFTPYYHPPQSFDIIERKGMCRNYRGSIANEINMLGCVTFVTRYGAVVGESVTKHFVGADSRRLRTEYEGIDSGKHVVNSYKVTLL